MNNRLYVAIFFYWVLNEADFPSTLEENHHCYHWQHHRKLDKIELSMLYLLNFLYIIIDWNMIRIRSVSDPQSLCVSCIQMMLGILNDRLDSLFLAYSNITVAGLACNGFFSAQGHFSAVSIGTFKPATIANQSHSSSKAPVGVPWIWSVIGSGFPVSTVPNTHDFNNTSTRPKIGVHHELIRWRNIRRAQLVFRLHALFKHITDAWSSRRRSASPGLLDCVPDIHVLFCSPTNIEFQNTLFWRHVGTPSLQQIPMQFMH